MGSPKVLNKPKKRVLLLLYNFQLILLLAFPIFFFLLLFLCSWSNSAAQYTQVMHMFKSSYACTDGLSYAVIVAFICTGKETHTHNSPSIGIKTFWECRCEEVVPHPSSGFTYLLFKAVLCCVIVQTHSHFVKCVKRQRARSKHNTWVVHPPVPFLCFCTYHTDVLWFWAALCLPTYSKEALHFLSSDDGNGIRLDPFIQQEREERKKCRSGMSHAHAAAL